MSTLLEIEEAIATLPRHEIVELSRWLDELQTGSGHNRGSADEVLTAQVEVARQRMQALDAGRSLEIPGERAHQEVRDFMTRQA